MLSMTLKSFDKSPMPIKMANDLFVDPRYNRRQTETDGALVFESNRALSEGSRLSSS